MFCPDSDINFDVFDRFVQMLVSMCSVVQHMIMSLTLCCGVKSINKSPALCSLSTQQVHSQPQKVSQRSSFYEVFWKGKGKKICIKETRQEAFDHSRTVNHPSLHSGPYEGSGCGALSGSEENYCNW